MRLTRAIILGLAGLIPSITLGLIVWVILGSVGPEGGDNGSWRVWLPCNVIPLGGLVAGIVLAWRNGSEYAPRRT